MKLINLLNNGTFKLLVDQYDNVILYCITATPKKLFDTYKKMNVFPIENTTTLNYHGWNDTDITLVDHISGIDFIRHVLDECAKELIIPDSKWFICREYKKKPQRSKRHLR